MSVVWIVTVAEPCSLTVRSSAARYAGTQQIVTVDLIGASQTMIACMLGAMCAME